MLPGQSFPSWTLTIAHYFTILSNNFWGKASKIFLHSSYLLCIRWLNYLRRMGWGDVLNMGFNQRAWLIWHLSVDVTCPLFSFLTNNWNLNCHLRDHEIAWRLNSYSEDDGTGKWKPRILSAGNISVVLFYLFTFCEYFSRPLLQSLVFSLEVNGLLYS